MGINNGDIAEKTISLAISATKLTADVLRKAIRAFLDGKARKTGRVSLKELARGGKIEAIEVSKANIADFRKTAAKYDVTYAIAKNADRSLYYVMFSSARAKNIERAFQEYAAQKVRTEDTQLFSRETQKQFREQALSEQRQMSGQQRSRKHEKLIER